MKKKILGGIAILGIAAIAALNMNFGAKSNGLSDVSLANVEALAGCESSVFTDWGREVDLTCDTQGGFYTLKACDFDTGYKPEKCTGRAAND